MSVTVRPWRGRGFEVDEVFRVGKATDWGKYVGEVVAKWNDDGRRMTLVQDFGYVSAEGVEWHAPNGSVVDGASIPRIAWTIVGSPYTGKYRDASVIHDVACDERDRSWKDVHRVFYMCMRCSGVGVVKAKVMFAAVYHCGPRWPSAASVRYKKPASPSGPGGFYGFQTTGGHAERRTVTERTFPELRALIEERERTGRPMTLDEIEQYRPQTNRVQGQKKLTQSQW